MIERAAKAVAEYTGQRLPPAGDIITCEGIVRAVLQAIREPSEAMAEAGRWPAEDDGPVACWKAMLDAAVSE